MKKFKKAKKNKAIQAVQPVKQMQATKTTKEIEKLTIEDLLAEKKINVKSNWYYDSTVLGKRIDYERINPSKVMDIVQEVSDNERDLYSANLYLIYLSVPMFRNKALQEKHEIKGNPYEVIEPIFKHDVLDITNFGAQILSAYGFTQQRLDEVKK